MGRLMSGKAPQQAQIGRLSADRFSEMIISFKIPLKNFREKFR